MSLFQFFLCYFLNDKRMFHPKTDGIQSNLFTLRGYKNSTTDAYVFILGNKNSII